MPLHKDQNSAAIQRFVTRLWQHVHVHVHMRAGGINGGDALRLSARAVKSAYDAIPNHDRQMIGEELAAYILVYTVQNLSRRHCMACREYTSGCVSSESGPCEEFQRDRDAYAAGRALLATSIYMLDGVYGINARQMLTLVCRFLDGTAGEGGQVGLI